MSPINKKLRRGLIESLPGIDQAGSSSTQHVPYTFVPPSHAKALDPESSLIEGIRGSGKSFWWVALASDAHRKFVSSAYPYANLSENTIVKHGYGEGSVHADFPSKDVIADLGKNFSDRAIWRAVLAHHAGFGAGYSASGKPIATTWTDRVGWVSGNAEEYDRRLVAIDNQLERAGHYLVVAYDALDRLADTWADIRPIARSLLQVALDLRATKRIRFKIFVRPDMLEDSDIIGFPDASKLLARRTTLTWRRVDLYALLFQCLGNSPSGGAPFRKVCRDFDLRFSKVGHDWALPPELKVDEEYQEALFIELAGKAMSSSPTGQKRGKPYSWLVNHLLDGREQVSPRSFSAAVREAAQLTHDEYFDYKFPLHFSAIQAGVQFASQVRVNELVKEDYPWVDTLMRPLRGNLTVPCEAKDIISLWRKSHVLADLERATTIGGGVKLPPQSLGDGHDGLLKDLVDLGVVQRLTDGRVQMPDVYRIAFGLGRRGGVKPLR